MSDMGTSPSWFASSVATKGAGSDCSEVLDDDEEDESEDDTEDDAEGDWMEESSTGDTSSSIS